MKLLAKIFIKDYKNTKDEKVRERYGVFCSIFGIITNLVVCVCKIIIGLITGAVSITADGINNLTDGGSSIITLVGFKMANKPADEKHPFGHKRIEYVNGMIISIIIVVIGLLFIKTSIEKIISKEAIDLTYFYLASGILVGSILIKIWQSIIYRSGGNAISSPALLATSKDSFFDILTTGVVLIALIVAKLANINIDGYIGLIVAIFIVINGIKMIIDTVSPLIGEAPTKEVVEEIRKKIMNYKGVLGCHDLIVHSYGPSETFISVHVEVDAKADILVSHDIIDNIERDFKKDDNYNVVIHMDPVVLDDEETNELKKDIEKIVREVNDKLSFHDFRVVKGPTHTNIIFDVVVPNGIKENEIELKRTIDKKVKELDSHYNTVINVDYNYTD